MSLIGKTDEEKIWNFLLKEISNTYGTAGLMGNLLAESLLRSNNMEDSYQSKLGYNDETYTQAVDNGTYTNFVHDAVGYGLAQWTFWTRKENLLNYAKENNKSISDLEMQLNFLIKELRENFKSVYNTLINASSVLEASNAVLLDFERPYDRGPKIQDLRKQYGENFYNKYTKGDSEMKTYTRGNRVQLSPNFVSTEFDCHGTNCCDATLIDPKLVEYLQTIRNHFNKPILISSAYRCPKHNKNIGGATASYHTKGQAADIVVSGVNPSEVAKYAESIGILGIGLYETASDGYFVHIDTRTKKAFWYGQGQAYRSTFGAEVQPETQPESQPENIKSKKKFSIELSYLQIGDSCEMVKNLQILLNGKGYELSEDGRFGAKTQETVVDFQEKNDLDPDGVVGADTMTVLLTK